MELQFLVIFINRRTSEMGDVICKSLADAIDERTNHLIHCPEDEVIIVVKLM